ncbi:rna exonuclease [Stemphylium lycopersici]|uniref:Rna exonuclease n=1 Tax=Stemphylium lycopersici TaxID=183478 RepID=A0A364NGF9_STELY|nr:rna exonuclease [Stemphylium lycopersici]RAR16350.1 rna exonuclease [Stemphylium lycopersici]
MPLIAPSPSPSDPASKDQSFRFTSPATGRRDPLSPVMVPRGGPNKAYHCAMCGESFFTKPELSRHSTAHADSATSSAFFCGVCRWDSDDSHALELHKLQNGHGTFDFACDSCQQRFISQKGLDDHQRSPNECLKVLANLKEMAVACDRCQKTFGNLKRLGEHRSDLASKCADWQQKTPPKETRQKPKEKNGRSGSYIDPDKPKHELEVAICSYDDPALESDASTNTSNCDYRCKDCKKTFPSQASFNNHWLGCTPVAPQAKPKSVPSKSREVLQTTLTAPEVRIPLAVSYATPGLQSRMDISQPVQMHTVTLNTRPPVRQQRQGQIGNSTPPQPASALSSVSSAPVPNTGVFVCNSNGCGKTFRSEAGLAQHKIDSHGVGGQRLDITGRDSWMLSQRERERLREEGLLRASSGPTRGRGSRHAPSRPPPAVTRPLAQPAARLSPITTRSPNVPNVQGHSMLQRPPAHIDPMPTSMNMGGAAEMEQAKQIQAKALRLLIQSDIFIHHDGRINVCGIDWTRIGVAKQLEVVDMFDKMCHLPRILQGEHLPVPKAFKDEYTAEYPDGDFKYPSTRKPAKPGLNVVALSCSKVVLEDGRQEVVKVAAVDLITCRILMNHLVCADPHANVADWRSAVTGLLSWRDMESARQAGYKVFKGWYAARSALQKYVDSETIILGHNLRSDLDALRLAHGRAVDIAKVVEKAANGPLTKVQLSLDKLCHNYPGVALKSDPEYGRDCLMNAFAVREVGLWAIKNKEKLERDARQKSLDYQRIRPAIASVA